MEIQWKIHCFWCFLGEDTENSKSFLNISYKVVNVFQIWLAIWASKSINSRYEQRFERYRVTMLCGSVTCAPTPPAVLWINVFVCETFQGVRGGGCFDESGSTIWMRLKGGIQCDMRHVWHDADHWIYCFTAPPAYAAAQSLMTCIDSLHSHTAIMRRNTWILHRRCSEAVWNC